MKEVTLPLVLILAVLGGVVWLTMRDRDRAAAQAAISPVVGQVESPRPSGSSAEPPKKRKVKRVDDVTAVNPIPDPQPMPAQAPVDTPVVESISLPFPSIDQIQSGLEQQQILDEYGVPALSTTTSDHEHIFETFVYAQDRRGLQTLIRMMDGKVLSAYSQLIPPAFDTPGSASRVRH